MPKADATHMKRSAEVSNMARGLNRNMKCMTQQAYARNAIAPAIMERASSAAYQEPAVAIVNASVARAIDGAAPNNPAKLFGLRIFPKVANAETKSPPTRNRNNSDVSMTNPKFWLAAPALISAQSRVDYNRITRHLFQESAICWIVPLPRSPQDREGRKNGHTPSDEELRSLDARMHQGG